MANILIPLPSRDFDPTEAAVPWQILRAAGHRIAFATPDGLPAEADPRMLLGTGLGFLAPMLRADANARRAYADMAASAEFRQPLRYDDIVDDAVDAVLLPGGHAPGMRPYLESERLQALVADSIRRQRPLAAICHGVLLAARSRDASGRSVLHGRRTTALTAQMELSAWNLTRLWLGDYYRTYALTVEAEVTALLAQPSDFLRGPQSLLRDKPDKLSRGFVVRDGHYLSARWPGDAHRLGHAFATLLAEHS